MHIHIQNLPGNVGEPLTWGEWQAAAARAGLGERHSVTLGETLEDFAKAAPAMDVLVTGTSATKQLFPADLPRLDFYYGAVRTATICRDGLYSVDFTEAAPAAAVGAFSLFGGGGALVAVLAAGNLTATQIQAS